MFADRVGVAPGLVVDRLQQLGVLRHDQLNGLCARNAMTDVR